jgi:hypothetical protein
MKRKNPEVDNPINTKKQKVNEFPAIIHPTCFNKEGHCFHWVQKTYDSKPSLYWGKECMSVPHITSIPTGQCGNPWNSISNKYAKKIMAEKPEVGYNFTHGERPVTNISFKSYEDISKSLSTYLCHDCWSVYSRDPVTHKVNKSYYFYPQHTGSLNFWNSKECLRESRKRDKLIKNPEPLIRDIKNGKELCLSYGGFPFFDEYFRQVEDNLVSKVSVHIP